MTFTNTQYCPQNKIEGKFYPLQTEEYMRACRELTKAQMTVFYYFKTIDPFGEKWININIAELAEQLGLSRITVSRALKVLDNLGWLEFELISVQGRVRFEQSSKCSKPIANDKVATSNCHIRPQMIAVGNLRSNLITNDQVRSQMIEPDHLRSDAITNDQVKAPETSPHKGFSSSKTINTLKTLSTSENEKPKTEREIGKKDKEKFQKFAKSKMEQLPKYPVLPKRWIAMHFEELWAEYEELEGRREENEERIRESIEKPQDTGLDPIIAAGLASGKIFLDPHPIYPMLRDANGYLHKFDEWLTAEKQRLAES